MKVHRWRNQNQWFQQRRDTSTWCHAVRGARGRILRSFRRCGICWHTWPCHLCHVSSDCHCAQEPSMHSWSTRRNSLHQILSCCRRSKEIPAKHHVPGRSRPSSLRTSCPVAVCEDVHDWRLLHPSRQFFHRKPQLTLCLDSDRWAASSTIGCKVDLLNQVIFHILHQSSEHQEYSLCFAFVSQSHL